MTKTRIFIGSSAESLKIAKAIKANFQFDNLEVRIWSDDLFRPGEYTLDELLKFTKSFDFAIFVWADDDNIEIVSRKIQQTQPRDNVILEAGMFYSSLGRDRVFLFAPNDNNPKIPSDLLGLSTIRYNTPSDNNYVAELEIGVSKIKKIIFERGPLQKTKQDSLPIKIYHSLEDAKKTIIEKCFNSEEIKILSNKGLEFFGSDNSIISNADINKFKNLKQLKILLLSTKSSWLNRGFMALRKYETIEDVMNELNSTHKILEIGMLKFLKGKYLLNSGIKHHFGEPFFRFILTDYSVFVSTYAENPTTQVRDLPVYEFNKEFGSLYGSLRKHFNDLWKNNSEYGETYKEIKDVEISAGGILILNSDGEKHIALVEREDGSWVLPKGHKNTNEIDTEQTAIREVSEETGIPTNEINSIKKIDSYTFDETANYHKSSKINYFYLMEYIGAESLPVLKTDPDHKSAKWWKLSDELPFLFYSYQKIVITEIMKNAYNIDVKINYR
ncbi:TIR domain-containing protein [Chryseobacterium gambrini]|uniref:TIR domain-containing protein n=1 Tax=Chryseobacterium gambrini TaxID=373672 RepID=UPI0022F3C329|nr:TIR domain-containing protein [Chryseobacterium gambrini]WBX98950.1 nucleotide-binding protein [Chryseobacterium gambrini]